MSNIERGVKAIARVLYMIDGADFDLIVRERADGPTATLVARRIAEALPDDRRERTNGGIRRSEDPIGDANKAVDDAVAESERRGNTDPEDVLAEWIVDLRDQLVGAVGALHEAIQLARDFNRGAMTWQEYDRKLAALEGAHPRGQ